MTKSRWRTNKSRKNKLSSQKCAQRGVIKCCLSLVCGFILFGKWLRHPRPKESDLDVLGMSQKPRNIIMSAEIEILVENLAKAQEVGGKWIKGGRAGDDDGDGDDGDDGRICQVIQAPSPTHPGTTYPVRVSPHSDHGPPHRG